MYISFQILSVASSEVLRFDMVVYIDGTAGSKFDDVENLDMDISLTMGRARIVFVYKFILSLMVSI